MSKGREVYEAIGRAIKVLRAQQGKGRRELAEAAQISYPYLSEIENGRKRPSSQALVAIAGALGVRTSQLLELGETLVEQMKETALAAPAAMVEPNLAARPLASQPQAHAAALDPSHGAPTWSWYRPAARFDEASPRDDEGRVAELVRLAAELSDDDLDRLTDLARRLGREPPPR
jgi:transcriptional regulator with XRE-family HTH domain